MRHNSPAFAHGRRVARARGTLWRLKGRTATMLVDAERQCVSFWAEGAFLTMRLPTPPGTPLTAAVALYANTAVVTGLQHVRIGADHPLAALAAGARGAPPPEPEQQARGPSSSQLAGPSAAELEVEM